MEGKATCTLKPCIIERVKQEGNLNLTHLLLFGIANNSKREINVILKHLAEDTTVSDWSVVLRRDFYSKMLLSKNKTKYKMTNK